VVKKKIFIKQELILYFMTWMPFYETVDMLFDKVMAYAPDTAKTHPKTSAFVLGTIGTYLTVKAAQKISEHGIDRLLAGFDRKIFGFAERLSGTASITLGLMLVTSDVPEQHPVYTWGMIGVWTTYAANTIMHDRNAVQYLTSEHNRRVLEHTADKLESKRKKR